jgi:hypothetical protein
LVERIWKDHWTAKLDVGSALTATRKLVDKISERVKSTAAGKGQNSTRVERNCLSRSLHIEIRAKPERVVASYIRKRVLELIVVEESS